MVESDLRQISDKWNMILKNILLNIKILSFRLSRLF
jgi:hypothetical protein